MSVQAVTRRITSRQASCREPPPLPTFPASKVLEAAIGSVGKIGGVIQDLGRGEITMMPTNATPGSFTAATGSNRHSTNAVLMSIVI